MELIWKIDVMDNEMFRKPKKGTMVNPQCDFSYFTVTTPKGYEMFGMMVNNLRIPIDEIRVFDPKGFVIGGRRQKSLGIIRHELLYKDDVLRNLVSGEAVMTRKKEWKTIMNIVGSIIKRNVFYISP